MYLDYIGIHVMTCLRFAFVYTTSRFLTLLYLLTTRFLRSSLSHVIQETFVRDRRWP